MSCFVFPKLTKGRIKEILPSAPNCGYLKSNSEYSLYWKKKYGYLLPPFDSYISVEINCHFMTYPCCCVSDSSSINTLVSQTKSQSIIILNSFIQVCQHIIFSANFKLENQ